MEDYTKIYKHYLLYTYISIYIYIYTRTHTNIDRWYINKYVESKIPEKIHTKLTMVAILKKGRVQNCPIGEK